MRPPMNVPSRLSNRAILDTEFARLHVGMQRACRLAQVRIVDAATWESMQQAPEFEASGLKLLTLVELGLEQPPEPEPEPTEPANEQPTEPTLEQWLAAGYREDTYEDFLRSRESHPDNARALDAVLENSLP